MIAVLSKEAMMEQVISHQTSRDPRTGASPDDGREAPGSAVSWGAIFAGAATAAALSLILLLLGSGLGLASMSPWANSGPSAATLGASAIAWLTFVQLAASGMGGYLAGRLRTKWAAVHGDEAYFRDTAHGFLTWAVATLVTAATLTSAIGSIVSGGASAASSLTGAAATVATAGAAGATGLASKEAGATSSAISYFTDSLFRRDGSATAPSADLGSAPTAESGRILASALQGGTLPPEDAKYLGQLVAQRTGMAAPEAEKRVNDAFTKLQTQAKNAETAAREAADKARKASAYASLWLFISMLIGAFVASLAATYGGRRRDL